jgi:microcystin-dependent protein
MLPIVAGDIPINTFFEVAYDSSLNGGAGGFALLTLPATSSYIPPGVMWPYGGSTAPTGFLLTNGAAVSRTGYSNLYGAIGTTFGAGDGSTTFNVPDSRGRCFFGWDPSNATGRLTASASGGLTAATLANNGGEQSHTLVTAELAAHAHGVNDPGHNHGVGDPGHGHGVSDPQHIHGVGDPGHGHGVGDPGHVHTQYGNNFAASYGNGDSSGDGGPILSVNTINTGNSGSGISIGGSGTGVYLGYSYTGIGIQGAGTGIYLGVSGSGISIQNNGSNSAHNNVPPGLITNFIIKY